MDSLFKLTDRDGFTRRGEHNQTLWGEGVSHTAIGIGGLCSSGLIHAYTGAALALLLNPLHANISQPRLWEAEGRIVATDNGLKVGCKTLTTVREIEVPEVSPEDRVKFAIYCALETHKDEGFKRWAEAWISGKDRSSYAARSTSEYVLAAYWSAESNCANSRAAWAARLAAESAAQPPRSAAKSAQAAGWAAESATWAGNSLNLAGIAERALKG